MSSPIGSGNEAMRRVKPEIKMVYVRRRWRGAPPRQQKEHQHVYVGQRLRDQPPQQVENQQVIRTQSQPISVSDGGMVSDESMAYFMGSLNNTQLLQFVELSAASSNHKRLHLNQEAAGPT